MRSEPPPPRYRVVEKGRRLVVIDRLTGAEAARAPPPTGPLAAAYPPINELPVATVPGGADRTVFDGGMRLRTIPLYDLKGPRTVVIDAAGVKKLTDARGWLIAGVVLLVGLLFLFPILAVPLAIIVLNPKVRQRLREQATAWLDRYASAG